MNKPLSETHPTLWRNISIDDPETSSSWATIALEIVQENPIFIQEIQSCTVDREEHDLIRKAYEIEQELRIESDEKVDRLRSWESAKLAEIDALVARERELEAEVDRLKKEIEEIGASALRDIMDAHAQGNLEGERRAKETIQRVLEKRFEHFERLIKLPRIEHKEEMKGRMKEIKALKNELGFGEDKEVRS